MHSRKDDRKERLVIEDRTSDIMELFDVLEDVHRWHESVVSPLRWRIKDYHKKCVDKYTGNPLMLLACEFGLEKLFDTGRMRDETGACIRNNLDDIVSNAIFNTLEQGPSGANEVGPKIEEIIKHCNEIYSS